MRQTIWGIFTPSELEQLEGLSDLDSMTMHRIECGLLCAMRNECEYMLLSSAVAPDYIDSVTLRSRIIKFVEAKGHKCSYYPSSTTVINGDVTNIPSEIIVKLTATNRQPYYWLSR